MCQNSKALIRIVFLILFCFPNLLLAQEVPGQETPLLPGVASWSSDSAQHVYGLPEVSAKVKGTLRLTSTELVFSSKSAHFAVPLQSVIALSAGDQRVELWGTKGRVLRMLIPNGGGLAAAGFMHHKIDTLTVEFLDSRGGYHGAVFFLPGNEAQGALNKVRNLPASLRIPSDSACEAGTIRPRSVRVSSPQSGQMDLPVAYRVLVYERLLRNLQKAGQFEHVYRDGELDAQNQCAQYTVELSLTGFKQGSQVKRATMGPVGMFVGATQLAFDLKVSDAQGRKDFQQQVKASVRSESESINVTDGVAKKLSKQVLAVQKSEGVRSTKS